MTPYEEKVLARIRRAHLKGHNLPLNRNIAAFMAARRLSQQGLVGQGRHGWYLTREGEKHSQHEP